MAKILTIGFNLQQATTLSAPFQILQKIMKLIGIFKRY